MLRLLSQLPPPIVSSERLSDPIVSIRFIEDFTIGSYAIAGITVRVPLFE
jgi:hypothetical protein